LFSLTPEGTLRFRPNAQSLTSAPVFSSSEKACDGKGKSMQESPKEEPQPSKKQPEKDEGTEFANRCLIDSFNYNGPDVAFRRKGAYAIG